MPAWFDIRGLGPSSSEDEDGIVKAAAALNQLIDKEIAAGIPANRIVIGKDGVYVFSFFVLLFLNSSVMFV